VMKFRRRRIMPWKSSGFFGFYFAEVVLTGNPRRRDLISTRRILYCDTNLPVQGAPLATVSVKKSLYSTMRCGYQAATWLFARRLISRCTRSR
jgi:hypothetical protein